MSTHAKAGAALRAKAKTQGRLLPKLTATCLVSSQLNCSNSHPAAGTQFQTGSSNSETEWFPLADPNRDPAVSDYAACDTSCAWKRIVSSAPQPPRSRKCRTVHKCGGPMPADQQPIRNNSNQK